MSSFINSSQLPAEGPDGIPTLNRMGFMATTLDQISQQFVTFASTSVQRRKDGESRMRVLEIGAAFGFATLATLQRAEDILVVAVDLDPVHIDILRHSCPPRLNPRLETIVGDFGHLELPEASFQGILAARVLHFMDGSTLRKTLLKCYKVLEVGGKLFIVSDSPYLKDSESFVPEFERRSRDGAEWPGLVEDIKSFGYPSSSSLPAMFHFLDPNILKRELEAAGFQVESAHYFPRTDYSPSARLDGREGVGAIGIKI